MRSFSDVADKFTGQKRGCPRCGSPKNKGQVNIQLRELLESGKLKSSVSSKAKSLCESCSVEVFEACVITMNHEIENGFIHKPAKPRNRRNSR